MITVHCIFHAHLDPVWLWPWTSGLDEAVATARSACDRLDAHPELLYTQGEAWTFAMIERADPELFARIRAHVASGRWEVINGWWTQPDCNQPSVEGFHAQLRTGLAYVKDRFGVTPRTGFNPDSFGHAAILPDVMRAHGQDRYLFMRPGDNEHSLPARCFRWRSRADGPAVTTFHVADSYINGVNGIQRHVIERAAEKLPEGLTHTLACFGVGNHGGGPTERMVQELAGIRDAMPGLRLEFSTVDRFFAAVEASAAKLPEVVGEIQHHAVGCYSVMRAVKTAVRRAEHALARADAAKLTDADSARGWETVCSHHFHDTLGGTSDPQAYPTILDALGGATARAEEALAYAVRRDLTTLPNDIFPRIVLAHPGDRAHDGWVEASTYVEGPWQEGGRLLDEAGKEVPFQNIHPGLGVGNRGWGGNIRRFLVYAQIPAGGCRVLRFEPKVSAAPLPKRLAIHAAGATATDGASIQCSPWGTCVTWADGQRLPIVLHLLSDSSDTWSHGITSYGDQPEAQPTWQAPSVLEEGPLRVALQQTGQVGNSRLVAEWQLTVGGDAVDLLLDVDWHERHRLLKLVLPMAGEATRRDGTPGMFQERRNDGYERPLCDVVATSTWGVVCPDVFAVDAKPSRARFTLLRSPLLAHHDPCPGDFLRAVVADQGLHRFRFRFHPGSRAPERLVDEAIAWQRPPLVADCTKGMPTRMIETK